MRVIVCGIKDVAKAQETQGITKVLSITEFPPYSFFSSKVRTDNTYIFCKDFETNKQKGCPDTSVLQKILKFSANCTNEDVILIHCFAGVSRSPAAAMIIAWDHMRDPEGVEKFIRAVRPCASPNRLLCDLADKWFNNKQPYLSNIAQSMCNEHYYNKLFDDKSWQEGIRK